MKTSLRIEGTKLMAKMTRKSDLRELSLLGRGAKPARSWRRFPTTIPSGIML